MRRNIPTERNKEDFPNRKFIRYSESYDFYGVSPHELRVMAETAGAVHKFGGTGRICLPRRRPVWHRSQRSLPPWIWRIRDTG